jgi:hypothetical protein
MGIWGWNVMRGITDQGMCPVRRKEKEWSHITRRKETKN